MRRLMGYGHGRLQRDAVVIRPSTGHPRLEFAVEFDELHFAHNGKRYTQRIEFRSFDALDIDRAPQMLAGTYVAFNGEVDAVPSEHEGRKFANPRVTGRVNEIINHQKEEVTT